MLHYLIVGHAAALVAMKPECFNMEDALEQAGQDIPITFDMLINVAQGQDVVVWKEGTVLIKLARLAHRPFPPLELVVTAFCKALLARTMIFDYRIYVNLSGSASPASGYAFLWNICPASKLYRSWTPSRDACASLPIIRYL
jgi:hypothetical protein